MVCFHYKKLQFKQNYLFPKGCLLVCDYGYDESKVSAGQSVNRDTFRAYRWHEACDPLKEPGTADLTADIDFAYIRRKLAHKAQIHGTITQEHFLKSLGIEVRLQVSNKCAFMLNDSNGLVWFGRN